MAIEAMVLLIDSVETPQLIVALVLCIKQNGAELLQNIKTIPSPK